MNQKNRTTMNNTKFRAWHKTEKIMCEILTLTDKGAFLVGVTKGKDQISERAIIYAPEEGRFCPMDEIELIQFTGLLSSDTAGLPIQEAYFGDIIEFYNTEGRRFVKEIKYNTALCCITFGCLPYYQLHESAYHQPSKIQFHIIGNKYQHPKLLETN